MIPSVLVNSRFHRNSFPGYSWAHKVIATCLTTGKPGAVVTAAFDKRRNIRLVLAKNGDVGCTDYMATRTFISDLMIASDWIDILPFLVNHSKTNIDKWIMRLQNVFLVFPTTGWGDASTLAFTPNCALFSTSAHQCYQNPLGSLHCKVRKSYPLVAASAA